MSNVHKSVLLPYTAHEMYALVTAVADYPKFLPWCAQADVLEEDTAGMRAKLHLAYGGLRMSFTTRNAHTPDRLVQMHLVDGPFSRLEGTWSFQPVGDEGTASRIDFDLRYDFASWPLKTVLSPVFDRVANTFVDAFVQRATTVYGPR